MIDSDACRQIIGTYVKHGWTLRRVLLTQELSESLGEALDELVGDASLQIGGTTDAAWFSRQPGRGEIAWEIRHLSETPFALVEYADEAADNFEDILRKVESRLTETVAAKRNA